jgi:hypothetical protein
VAGEAGHQQPRRSGDARRADHDKDRRDHRLNGDHRLPSIGYGEADVDGRDQGQPERIDGCRVQPPQAQR